MALTRVRDTFFCVCSEESVIWEDQSQPSGTIRSRGNNRTVTQFA